MKNKFMKRTLSLVLVLMMVLSVSAVSFMSVSAASNENVEYEFEFCTAGSSGTTNGVIVIKVNGTNGSTSYHRVGLAGNTQKKKTASFTDVNVGEIESITAYVTATSGWYPNYIEVSTPTDSATIYGGRWLDVRERVTMYETDNVLKVTVDTADVKYAGTDGDVKISFYDTDGNFSGETELSSIHPKKNAFERDDCATFYIYAPDNFGKLRGMNISVGGSDIYSLCGDWKLEDVSIEYVSGAYTGVTYSKTINQWIEFDEGTYIFTF